MLLKILISETTRGLLGNKLPEDIAIADLGEKNLKERGVAMAATPGATGA